MLSFAWCGIVGFSNFPLRIITVAGGVLFSLSIISLISFLALYFSDHYVSKYIFMILALALFSGTILLALGIIGEYIDKIFTEVKARPRYQIEKMINV